MYKRMAGTVHPAVKLGAPQPYAAGPLSDGAGGTGDSAAPSRGVLATKRAPVDARNVGRRSRRGAQRRWASRRPREPRPTAHGCDPPDRPTADDGNRRQLGVVAHPVPDFPSAESRHPNVTQHDAGRNPGAARSTPPFAMRRRWPRRPPRAWGRNRRHQHSMLRVEVEMLRSRLDTDPTRCTAPSIAVQPPCHAAGQRIGRLATLPPRPSYKSDVRTLAARSSAGRGGRTATVLPHGCDARTCSRASGSHRVRAAGRDRILSLCWSGR